MRRWQVVIDIRNSRDLQYIESRVHLFKFMARWRRDSLRIDAEDNGIDVAFKIVQVQ